MNIYYNLGKCSFAYSSGGALEMCTFIFDYDILRSKSAVGKFY